MAGFSTRPGLSSPLGAAPQAQPGAGWAAKPAPTPARVAATVAAKKAKQEQRQAEPEPVADQHGQFPAPLVDQFHAAREVITAEIQALLVKAQAHSEDDEARYQQLHEEIEELSRQRGALAVGSQQVREVLDQARQRQHETLPTPQPPAPPVSG